MKCQKHKDADAVGQCVECGAGVCVDCTEALEPFSENGLRCANCVEKKYRECIADTEKENKRLLRNNIISIVLYIIGIVLIVVAIPDFNEDSVILIIAGVVCCGIFMGIAGWKTMRQVNDEYEEKHGAEYIMDEQGIHKNTHFISKLLLFIFGLVIGIVFTPICVIQNFRARKRNVVEIKEMYEDIETVQSI